MALVSTVLIVGIGFLWASKVAFNQFETENVLQKDSPNESLNTDIEPDSTSSSTTFP